MSEAAIKEKQSSVELSRNAKDQYSWKIKLYYDDEQLKEDEIVDYLHDLNESLKIRFIGGK